jgi:ERF superfamily protein
MGAALTYARRYALFTLVGIAGEDDLDAPDIACGPMPSSGIGDRRDRCAAPAPDVGNGNSRDPIKRKPTEVLDADQSAALRATLVAQLAGLESAEAAVGWAARVLPAKNSLTAPDAKLLEDVFEQKLSSLSLHPGNEAPSASTAATKGTSGEEPKTSPEDQTQVSAAERVKPSGIDKSVLAVAAPRRYRNREHLRYVAQQACLVCGRKPSDAHHLRHVQPRALGRKASDEFAVPLCRSHHRAVHRAADERAWWQTAGIDPLKVAHQLWKQTRANEGRLRPDRMTQGGADSDQALKTVM